MTDGTPAAGRAAPRPWHGQRGVTLLEILVTLTMIAVVTGITANYTLEWIRRERLRGALYTISTQLELARLEALNRNRACRVVVDKDGRTVRVVDLNDPTNPYDDRLLNEVSLPEGVRFQSPDSSEAVTFAQQSGSLYAATYSSDGVVTSGAGQLVIEAAGRFGRVTLFVAGGTSVEHWKGGAWHAGT